MKALVATAILLASVVCSLATDPFGNSCISKDENGNWQYPGMFTGNYLFIEHGTNWARLSLDEIFPGDSYDQNVCMTTAGPLWGEPSFYYVFSQNGIDYFSMWCPSGKRVLLNLTTPKIEDPDTLLEVIQKEDKKRVVSFLAESAAIASEHDKGLHWEKVYAGMLLIVEYGLTNAVNSLRVFEEHSWQGPLCFHQGNYEQSFGLKEAIATYNRYDGRRYAQLALRRLGYKPAGYRAKVFEKAKINDTIPPDDRKKASSNITVDSTAREVYDLVGPPDYMLCTRPSDDPTLHNQIEQKWYFAWRYDFDAPDDFSLILVWGDKGGLLEQLVKITPSLWRGGELFPKDEDPFYHDGGLNGTWIYSPKFRGKKQVSKRTTMVNGKQKP